MVTVTIPVQDAYLLLKSLTEKVSRTKSEDGLRHALIFTLTNAGVI